MSVLRVAGDHRFIDEKEHLTAPLSDIRFSVRRVRYNRSPLPELRDLHRRDFGLDLFRECIKR